MSLQVHLYEELPRHKVAGLRGPQVFQVDGEDVEQPFVAAKTISTYPLLSTGERDGDPIADRLFVHLHPNRAVIAVADGCNWGRRPQLAAHDAIVAFSNYFNERANDVRDVQDIGHFLFRAFSEAHNKIVQGKSDLWEAGTTTLIGAVIVELIPEKPGDPNYGIVCASVGDCKAFVVSTKNRTATDVTVGNRSNLNDARDPGGRLGPYVGHGWPDLRNLRLYFSPCELNDFIVVVSDGVHDNLDPQMLGRKPRDFEINVDTWDKIPPETSSRIKSHFMKMMLEEIIFSEPPTPALIVNKLISHCLEVTRKSRDFMEQFPNKKQPNDFVEFPGKMDHTTCVALIVGVDPTAAGGSGSMPIR